jgi:hypothetical protein
MTEKNEGPRLLVMFERGATGGDRSQAIASEISLGGLFIETKTPMPNGTLLTIEISSGHDNVTLEGRVFSTRTTQEGPKLPPGMAVRFLDLPMAAVAKLTSMLERHRPPARTQIGTGAPPPPTPQDGIPALDVGLIPPAAVPSDFGAPAPAPNFKGTAIMGGDAQADAMAQVAAAKDAAAAAAVPAKPNFKGTAIMGDPGAQADAMAQVAAAKAAAAAAPPKKLPFAGTMAMAEAPARPDLQFAPTPEAPPAFVPAAAPAQPMPAPPAPIPAPIPVPVGDPGMGFAPPAYEQHAYATPAAPPYHAGPSPGIAPPQPWGQPAPMMGAPMMGAPQKSNATMIIVIILVLFFVLSGGLGVLFWAMR